MPTVQDRTTVHKKVVRRRRAVFGSLVLASIALVTIYFGESAGGGLHTIQRGAQAVLSPIEAGVSTVLKPFRDGFNWVGGTLDAQGENDELEARVDELERELATARTSTRDAEDLRELARLTGAEDFPEIETLPARVIAQSPTAWYSSVQIDKGSDDGVRVAQPVVTGGGLAGEVTAVTGGSATVTLITDADSAVSAELVPRGLRGVVKPQVGNPDDLLLDFIEQDAEIEEGTTVVTSGSTSNRLESLFPRGIPIGEVSRVDTEERELYQRVHLKPFADMRGLSMVEVLLTDGEPVEAADADAAE